MLLFALAVPVAQVVIIDAELRIADLAGFGAAFVIWLGLLHWPPRVRAGVAGVYNRAVYETEKATALARWDEHLMATVAERDSNVTTLRW